MTFGRLFMVTLRRDIHSCILLNLFGFGLSLETDSINIDHSTLGPSLTTVFIIGQRS